jgi:ribosomal protein L28
MANIQKVTLSVGEEKIKGSFCTKCLKRIKKETKEQKTVLK